MLKRLLWINFKIFWVQAHSNKASNISKVRHGNKSSNAKDIMK